MSHQEENQTLPHIQPMQHIPEPLPVLTHSVEQYIEWLTGNSSEQPSTSSEQPSTSSEQPSNSSEQPSNSSEQPSTSSEQHKKLEPPQIRRTHAYERIYDRPCDSSEQPSNSSEQPTIRREHANFLITDNVILYPGMWSLES
jgi:hypothetical protein